MASPRMAACVEALHHSTANSSAAARCAVASGANCGAVAAGRLPLLRWHVCEAEAAGVPALSVLLQLCWLLFMFYLLVSTAQRYFVPALSKATLRLGVPPHVAAITLLAVGNGSPDLFSAGVAISHGFPELAVAGVLGASVLLVTLTLGVVMIVATDPVVAGGAGAAAGHGGSSGAPADAGAGCAGLGAQLMQCLTSATRGVRPTSAPAAPSSSASLLLAPSLPRRPFLRDALVLCVVAGVFALVVVDGRIELWESILFIGVYVVYVAGVMLARFINQRRQRRDREALGIVEDAADAQLLLRLQDDEDDFGDDSILGGFGDADESDDPFHVPSRRASSISRGRSRGSHNSGSLYGSGSMRSFGDHFSDVFGSGGAVGSSSSTGSGGSVSSRPRSQAAAAAAASDEAKWWRRMVQRVAIATRWRERSVAGKVLFVCLFPARLARDMTIPRVAEGEWSRLQLVCSIAGLPILFLFAIQSDFWNLSLDGLNGAPVVAPTIALLGCLAAGLAHASTSPSKPPQAAWAVALLILLAVAGSACWLYLIANEVVGVLLALGVIADVRTQVMGLTLVAWGNSAVDLVANIVVARQGFPGMAVAACFAGPAFALLVGIGINVLIPQVEVLAFSAKVKATVNASTGALAVPRDVHLMVAFAFLTAGVVSSLFGVPLARFTTNKWLGGWLIVLYLAFLTCAVLVETCVIADCPKTG